MLSCIFSLKLGPVVFQAFLYSHHTNSNTINSFPTKITKNNCKNFTLPTSINNRRLWTKQTLITSVTAVKAACPFVLRTFPPKPTSLCSSYMLNKQIKIKGFLIHSFSPPQCLPGTNVLPGIKIPPLATQVAPVWEPLV